MDVRVEIYALTHPVTGEVRYIGKANDTQKRLKSHIRDARRRDTPIYRWIKKLVSNGMVPVAEIIEVCDSSTWEDVEIRLIATYKREGHRLLNVALGGDEPFCSVEQRAVNGRNTARAIHDNPKSRRLWELKKSLGDVLCFFRKRNDKERYNNLVCKLKIIADKYPDVFGKWLTLQEMT